MQEVQGRCVARVSGRHVGYLDESKGEDGPIINNLGAGISDLVPETTTRNYDLEVRYYIWYLPTYTEMHGFVKRSRLMVVPIDAGLSFLGMQPRGKLWARARREVAPACLPDSNHCIWVHSSGGSVGRSPLIDD